MRTAPIAALALALACGGKPPPPPVEAPPPAGPTPVAVERPAPSPIASPADALSYLGSTTDAILGIDVGALMSAEILAPYRESLLAAAPPELAALRDSCDFDLLRDIHWVVFGAAGDGEGAVFVLRGAFSRDAIEQCIRAHDATATIRDRGSLRVYGSGDDAVFARWLGYGTVVFTTAEVGSAELLEQAAGPADTTLIDRVAQVVGSDVWVVANRDISRSMPMPNMVGVRMSGSASTEITATLTIDYADASAALASKQQIDAALKQLPGMAGTPIGSIIQSIRLEAVGPELSAHIALSAADVKVIADLARSMP